MVQSGVILDTNVFIAAAFNSSSDSARIIEAVRQNRLRLVWSEATRRETERLIRQIPRLSWKKFAGLFKEEDCYRGETHLEQFGCIPDPDDRKFAALADAMNVPLVTRDAHLLQGRDRVNAPILTPGEFLQSGYASALS